MHAVALRHPTGGNRIEAGAFEKDARRALRHSRAGTAHDAGQADDRFVVRDDEIFRVEFALHFVESDELLAGLRAPHDEPVAGQLVEVVGVHWPAEFPHHEVRDVDNVVDRTQPDRLEPIAHPLGRRADLDVDRDARNESRTGIVPNVDAGHVVAAQPRVHLAARRGQLQFVAARQRELPGNAEMIHRVRAIAREIEVQRYVVAVVAGVIDDEPEHRHRLVEVRVARQRRVVADPVSGKAHGTQVLNWRRKRRSLS